jgi:hypothetical protein
MVRTSPHVPYTPRAILIKNVDDSSALLKEEYIEKRELQKGEREKRLKKGGI